MTDATVDRLNAALDGRYAIERELGEGGMATVYLADDLKHERKVALKVLKPELAAVVGAERFLAEIKTTANLQHPHILPLHHSGEADGFLYFVMPYVEGETLHDKLEREKQLSVEDALEITRKVASALDYAHKHGVVHRDIKPANILLSDEGEPTVADFGIALAVQQAGGGRVTETGLSLGTPHYMSPEQATGDGDIGPRSDVYALGCVLYEMLTGEPPYTGTSAQAVLAKILTEDAPAATKARASVSPNVDAAIRKALEKLPADRFTAAPDFAKALDEPGFRHGEEAVAGVAGGRGQWTGLAVTTTGLALVLAVALGWSLLGPEAPEPEPVVLRAGLTNFDVSLGGGVRFAISRDGSLIVATSQSSGPNLFIRRADELEFREIPGTEDALYPTFSPDGEWLAFRQGVNEIMRVQTSGGPVLPVASGTQPHWGLEDMIVFGGVDGLYSVSPPGGEPTLLLSNGDSLVAGRPFLLPNGEAVVFEAGVDLETKRLMMVELGSGSVTDLGITGNDPQYVPTGHLVFGHASQALMAVPFDLASHEVMGEPFTVLTDVRVRAGGATQFVVSETGTALYGLTGFSQEGNNQLVEVDLNGVETRLPLDFSGVDSPRYSPNGRYIAYYLDPELRIYDRETGANNRLSIASGGVSRGAVWSADGRYVFFASREAVETVSYRRLSDLSEEPEPIYRGEGSVFPVSASPSGEMLMSGEVSSDRGQDLLIMSEGQDGMVFTPYLRADWNEYSGAISPDGDWVAYVSDEAGQPEVYVRSFPDATDQVPVSVDGGREPVWSPNGTAIYYRSLDGNRVMRASVTSEGGFRAETPQLVIEGNWAVSSGEAPWSRRWDVHPDGDRFVLVRRLGPEVVDADTPGLPIRVVVNWFEELRERAGAGR